MGCADRLSPGLLMHPKAATLLHQQRRKSVWWTFFVCFFFHLATVFCHSSERESELSVFPLVLYLQEAGAASSHSSIWDYTFFLLLNSSFLRSINHSTFIFPRLFFLNWVFLSSVLCLSLLSTHSPWGYYCITLSHEFCSQAESRSNETEGEHFLLSAWLQIGSSSQIQAMYLLQHWGLQPRWQTSEIRV